MDEVTRILIFTTLFTFSAAVLIVLSFIISRRRQLHHRKQLLEREFKTREEALLQVSRDLHDDIGSSLSGINMLGQLAQQQLNQENYDTANGLLQKISSYTNELIEKVSDMAWLLKPNPESLAILVNKLKTQSLPTTSLKNIALHFDTDFGTPGKELSIQQRKTIYLISKEAINNAIKYSACKNIYYSLHPENNKLKLVIKDDGTGFIISEINSGNGLINMKSRAAEAGAGFHIESSPEAGTIVTVELQ
jgi:signal transduction histidine kinase